ncbi:hypothetical protein JFR02_003914 [Vibrio harveyi]|nr:hypothetical protein [Vibrio harveyi]
MNSDIKRNFKLDQFHQLVELLINQYDIPTETKRVALNLKVASFYRNRSGIHTTWKQVYCWNVKRNPPASDIKKASSTARFFVRFALLIQQWSSFP